MAAGTLTPSAVSGTSVRFTSSTAVFFTSDVGRLIISGASRAVITAFGASAGDTTSPNPVVRADILDVFPNTDPIPAGLWLMRLSPQSALDADKKEPVGGRVVLTADKPTFRLVDVGKFIVIHGGLVRIKTVNSVTEVGGEILSALQTTDANPPSAPAGSWTLEEPSWTAKNGYPRTGEFFQGRLFQASTFTQPTTFWGSQSDGFDRYAVGTRADDAIDYTIASRRLNRIEWLVDNADLLIGTSGAELVAKSGKTEEPFGGDVVPKVDRAASNYGSAPIQPVTVHGHNIFVDRGLLQIIAQAYSFEQNAVEATELTAAADHITGTGIRLGPIAFQRRPDSRLFFVRTDGTLLALTYFVKEKVVGFTRFVTQGNFEAVGCIPSVAGEPDQVWVIVARVINGVTRRYIEVFDEVVATPFARAWQSLQTDSAVTYVGASTTTMTGLGHLEGRTVQVVADGRYAGTKVVANGQITLDDPATEIEVGLGYESRGVTFRPAIPQGATIEGMPRSWDKLWLRLHRSWGGVVNGERISYATGTLGTVTLFTGDREVTGIGWGTDGRITFEQLLPYPFTVLAAFGTLSLGDND